jgi:hypothetical protein
MTRTAPCPCSSKRNAIQLCHDHHNDNIDDYISKKGRFLEKRRAIVHPQRILRNYNIFTFEQTQLVPFRFSVIRPALFM